MREYGTVAPQFWTGETGKALKSAGPEAVIVALYLMTSPHANMVGIYFLPKIYLGYETGLGIEGASKGLARAIEAGFCDYDEASEHVFVYSMARYQVGRALAATDKRCKGVENELSKLPGSRFVTEFRRRYASAYHLSETLETGSPKEGACKPLASQEQEQEQEQEQHPLVQQAAESPTSIRKAAKVAEATAAAIETFNASPLTKRNGGLLANVSSVGIDKRRAHIGRCLKTAEEIAEAALGRPVADAEFWRAYWETVEADPFHSGKQGGGRGHENWLPDFEYLTRPAVMAKLYERVAA